MQYCRIISLENKNSVKFTSSREDNSTTNDSTVMKIAHAQLHMYKNIMYKFQSSTCKTAGEKLWTKIMSTDRQTDRQTAMAIPVYPPPLRCGGYNNCCMKTLRVWKSLKFVIQETIYGFKNSILSRKQVQCISDRRLFFDKLTNNK